MGGARVDSGHNVLAHSCKCELTLAGRSINGSSLGHRQRRFRLPAHLVKNQCQKVTNSSAPLSCRLQAAGQSHLPEPLATDKGRWKFRYKKARMRTGVNFIVAAGRQSAPINVPAPGTNMSGLMSAATDRGYQHTNKFEIVNEDTNPVLQVIYKSLRRFSPANPALKCWVIRGRLRVRRRSGRGGWDRGRTGAGISRRRANLWAIRSARSGFRR